MTFKYNVDNNLEYKNLLEKINLDKNNGLYIYGKAGVGKTTFSKKLVDLYETQKQNLKQKIKDLDNEYNVHDELYKRRLKDKKIERTHWLEITNKYGSFEKWKEVEWSFPENIKMDKISKEKNKLEEVLKQFSVPVFFNVQKFISDIQASWSKKYSDSTQVIENNIYKFANASLLIIDDLGVEFIHESTYPYIYEIFEKRFEKIESMKLTTIITTNYSLEQLQSKYSKKLGDEVAVERLFSRVEGLLSKYIEFIGEDKRKNKLGRGKK